MLKFGLKAFRHDGCISYLLWDPQTRQAAFIDPNLEILEDLRDYVNEQGLKPVIALDTHVHADHYSCSHILREQLKIEIGMSAATRSQRPTRKLRQGDRIELGALKITTLETPGHTSDSVSFAIDGAVFTGDTLLIGGSGRTDFPGADPAAEWKSLHQTLGALADSTVVYPGHDYNDILFSTIGTEKAKNPHYEITDLAKFVSLKNSESIANPEPEIRRRLDFNVAANPPPPPAGMAGTCTKCGVPAQAEQSMGAINVEKYWAKLQKKAPDQGYFDVRDAGEFADGHPPGAKNIPLSELGQHVAELMKEKRIYFSCLSGRRSSWASKTLSYLGHADVVNVTGGFKAWTQAGLPVEK